MQREEGFNSRVVEKSLKKRKVRKGTQSCWECKRRKIRCVFQDASDDVCTSCKSREVACVSQEFPDSGVSVWSSEELHERLLRVEAILDQPPQRQAIRGSCGAVSGIHSEQNKERDEYVVHLREDPGANVSSSSDLNQYKKLNAELLKVWPNQTELDMIVALDIEGPGHLHWLTCTAEQTMWKDKVPLPKDILLRPGPQSHPVHVAKRLLILASYLQCLSLAQETTLSRKGIIPQELKSHAVTAAHQLVISNNELVSSIDGVECIMMESLFYSDAGDLRQAWVSVRHAISIAQLIGLHRRRNADISAERTWFRLIQSDRYLALMLGLPQATAENSFAAENIAADSAAARLQYFDVVAAGRILYCNRDTHNFDEICEIDKLLQAASKSMPPQWWLMPRLVSFSDNPTKSFQAMKRMMDQLAHYYTLTRLHLPYLLKSSIEQKYEHSKMTAIFASREVLTRFVELRRFHPLGRYCRGTDFLAFTASTILCLLHIDAHRQRRTGANDGCISKLDVLTHQRASDRGLMESTLEKVDHMARASKDTIAYTVTNILKQLLAIELDAMNGSDYTSSVANQETTVGYGGDSSNLGKILRIDIASFGTIQIEKGNASQSILSFNSSRLSGKISMTRQNALTEHTLYDAKMIDQFPHQTNIHSSARDLAAGAQQRAPVEPDLSEREDRRSNDGDIAQQDLFSFSEADWGMLQSIPADLNGDAASSTLREIDTTFFESLLQGCDSRVDGLESS